MKLWTATEPHPERNWRVEMFDEVIGSRLQLYVGGVKKNSFVLPFTFQ